MLYFLNLHSPSVSLHLTARPSFSPRSLDAKKNTFFEFQKFIECVLFYLRTGRHDKVLESSISPNRVRLCCSGKQKGSYYLDERGSLMHRVELGVSREVIYDVEIRDGILNAYHMEDAGHNCMLAERVSGGC